ncbi:MAG TPA: DUF1684 domain-containing protein [Nocardioides sp.]|uniref:DUF1684 domain-containing protein n=1 Tax=Nocardioides sp. TaxID=35761 RepID=UPI002E3755E2|nr:DUF1684 domain-containing protein [Nocardioides sp.]HEX5090428.1 DUF1684 domain-containing protein [Nocardioides sp.]
MDELVGEWQAWREERERGLRAPHGWLAITAIHWLTDESQRFDDVPGSWTGRDHEASVSLAAGESLSLDGRVLGTGTHRIGPFDDLGLRLAFGDAVAQVAARDDQVILRPRHPDSPNLTAYRETPCYPPDLDWVLRARYEPYAEPDGDAIGEVAFEHGGSAHRLVAWDADDGSLWLLFRDATSGVTTYAALRQLVTAPPAPDGTVELDFNRAYNLPCAYTDFATCPVPPPANTLPFAVDAGEQIPLLV